MGWHFVGLAYSSVQQKMGFPNFSQALMQAAVKPSDPVTCNSKGQKTFRSVMQLDVGQPVLDIDAPTLKPSTRLMS